MDGTSEQLREKLDGLLKRAAEVSVELDRGNGTIRGVPHYSVIDEALAKRPEESPDLAVVECDGGRARTREPGHGPGVHLSTDSGWRETKNACLIRAQRKTFDDDPQSEPPACFCDPTHAAKIAETEALSVAAPLPTDEPVTCEDDEDEVAAPPDDWRPKRLVRTVVSSMSRSKEFGRQMQRQAKRRRFFEATAQAFLGDGLEWNWSIWEQHFQDFTPILDFTHVLSYPFVLAKSLRATRRHPKRTPAVTTPNRTARNVPPRVAPR